MRVGSLLTALRLAEARDMATMLVERYGSDARAVSEKLMAIAVEKDNREAGAIISLCQKVLAARGHW